MVFTLSDEGRVTRSKERIRHSKSNRGFSTIMPSTGRPCVPANFHGASINAKKEDKRQAGLLQPMSTRTRAQSANWGEGRLAIYASAGITKADICGQRDVILSP